ncbi:hypothetical protein [Streptomyces palmae]|uniref:Uncharacterized protein n=1 Tax=Streptomyces palmae TaxID=1701085 RepID=A0A4Z0GIV1_9ACTN|nr:hypothetical protein [Streptomyces palmae]TGA95661.1 hypothetical protein E4099_24905 [Streptomyces palmae]
MVIGASRRRSAAARVSWLALVLLVLVHVVGCAHGPLSGGLGRVDSLAPAAASAAAQAAPTPEHAVERPGSCGHHHAPHLCAGVDEPVLAQTGWDKGPLPQPALPAVGGVPVAAPGRAPPDQEQESSRSGARRQAALQVWRN